MQPSIAFLHTSPVHVQTFADLLERLQPGMPASHVVDESLLRHARALGHSHPEVVQRVQSAVRSSASSGARVVACTCSTIGAAAELTPTDGRFKALRIDRAMADEAVRRGPAVLVVAALESTLQPTIALIEDSASRLGLPVAMNTALAANAWHYFEKGDLPGYLSTVRSAVRQAVPGPSVVVLAQASMADAVAGLDDVGIPVLSSPALGVQAAIAFAERPARSQLAWDF